MKKTIKPQESWVYAIRVMTTKRGKKRKKKAWARQNRRGGWLIAGQSLAWLVGPGTNDVFVCRETAATQSMYAEAALGCDCHVAKVALREVDDDE